MNKTIVIKVIDIEDGRTSQENYIVYIDENISQKLIDQIADDTGVFLLNSADFKEMPLDIKKLIIDKLIT